MRVIVYGASDDLVELEGGLVDEFSPTDASEGMLLAFSDGTILDVEFDEHGVWRITQAHAGTAEFSKTEGVPGSDADYTDRVTLDGDIAWALAAEKVTLVRAKETV